MKINPCYFCGSHDVSSSKIWITRDDGSEIINYQVMCSTCDASGPGVDANSGKGFLVSKKAVLAWNTLSSAISISKTKSIRGELN